MKHIVITGSTRGIGRGLAAAFLDLGCRVTISGRRTESVSKALESLSAKYDTERVFGRACEVSDYKQVRNLWAEAQQQFGRIDIWINNAGIGQPWKLFRDVDPGAIESLVRTNIQGLMHGTHVALQGMLEQGEGMIFNMEGFGSNGSVRPMMSLYGSSKRAVRYFTRSMVREVRGTAVRIGFLSPGMVVTDLLMSPLADDPQAMEQARKIFNILADRVETVTPFLARKVLAARENGIRVAWLTRGKVFWRFLSAAFNKRDLFTAV